MAKFKFNWGWAMVLVFITFMSIFLYVFYVSMQYAKEYDLVVEDYYTAELQYGDELKKLHAADTMRIPLKVVQTEKQIQIIFPAYISKDRLKGQITFFKPDNKRLDKTIPIQLDTTNVQSFYKDSLVPGRWNIIVNWKLDSIEYLKKEKIYIK